MNRSQRALYLLPLSVMLAAFLSANCGGYAKSPADPTSVAAGNTSAAVISGSVTGAGGVADTTSGSQSGMRITVSGSNVSSAVDGAGRFQLTVPAGAITLVVSGGGASGTIDLGTVAAGDRIDITIRVTGGTAALDRDDRDHDGERELEGLVTAVPPATPAGTFQIGSTLVTTSSTTSFKLNGHTGLLADIVVGARVHVKGMAGATSSAMTATDVNIQNNNQGPGNGNDPGRGNGGPDNDENEAEASGAVAALSGACPALAFTVGATHVVTTSSTRFDLACASVANGVRVEVEGTRAANGTVTATTLKRD